MCLLSCLNNRLIEAAQGIVNVEQNNQVALEALQDAQLAMQNVNSSIDSESFEQQLKNWKFNGNEKKAIAFLKLVKRLQKTLKTEHTKGNIITKEYVAEDEKLDNLKTKINIENIKKRAHFAVKQHDYGSAIQILKKGIAYVESQTGQYAVNLLSELHKMLDETSASQQSKEKQISDAQHTDHMTQREKEINQLFEKSKTYW